MLRAHPVDVLHANHVVLQPTIAADACVPLGIPFIIYPHGSAIEYAVRRDRRYRELAGEAIAAAAGLIIGSREVQRRLLEIHPEQRTRIEARTEIVGVGVDTTLFTPVPGERAARSAACRGAQRAASRPGCAKILKCRVRAEGFGAIRPSATPIPGSTPTPTPPITSAASRGKRGASSFFVGSPSARACRASSPRCRRSRARKSGRTLVICRPGIPVRCRRRWSTPSLPGGGPP